jgi:hypothetical protein
MLAWLFDGPNGWDPNDENWWKREPKDYKDQVDWACHKCGAALPLVARESNEVIDDISPRNLERLRAIKSPKVISNKYKMYDKGLLLGQNRARDWFRS